MNEKVTAIKAALASFLTALGAFLGWQGVMIVLWVITMGIDYLSGTIAACCAGQWSSAVAREGLKHKGGMILVVSVAALADVTLDIIGGHLPVEMDWPMVVLPLVLAWYILTELGSILENAIKLGAPVPRWLMRLLTVGLKAIDKKAEAQVENAQEDTNEEADLNEQ